MTAKPTRIHSTTRRTDGKDGWRKWALAAALLGMAAASPPATRAATASEAAGAVGAAGLPEAGTIAALLADGLPETLAVFPGGELRRAEFRAAVLERARAPWAFDVKNEFYYQLLVQLAAAEAGLGAPSPDILDEHYALARDAAGGEEALAVRLALDGRTPHDYRRIDIPAGYQLLRLGRRQLGLGPQDPLPDTFAAAFMEEQMRRRHVVWHGWEAPLRVATVGGRDYTEDELVSFTVRFALDRQLSPVFEQALAERLAAAESARRGGAPVSAWFGDELSEARLRAWYAERGEAFDAVAAYWIFLPFSRFAPSPDAFAGGDPKAAQAAREATWAEATRMAARIAAAGSSEAEFAARARDGSGTAAANGGFLGYVPGADWVAEWMEPGAYSLARLPGGASPLVAAPEAGVREALRGLREGGISEPVLLSGGYALIRKGAARERPPFEAVAEGLRNWRLHTLMGAWLEEARKRCEVKWRPEDR